MVNVKQQKKKNINFFVYVFDLLTVALDLLQVDLLASGDKKKKVKKEIFVVFVANSNALTTKFTPNKASEKKKKQKNKNRNKNQKKNKKKKQNEVALQQSALIT